ncbi:alpha-galactosidase [Pontibacillus halophilus JSM 076056 = DSM 19796]|uniref:Alpha-galactosidase n=1 Tax=Pontibacillus halophilus JSM 076056 = DSM 19796 TaxID=1385510 RepID=A0A0A5IDQ8_9BACI|nr:alpha-galactosidase [Pontibacillus halophilus]KGX93972.1 alpha-galactosidase [Pontibacillus halophilus JSM 076056 = DSM 19796]
MPIYVNEETRQFHLQGNRVSYIFHVMRNGQLGHLHYGKRLADRSYQHLQREEERPNTTYVYEGDSTFSLDLARQEYPTYGTTDYREPALHVVHPDGSRVTDLEYVGYTIVAGKPSLSGLPATYVEEDSEAETLLLRLADATAGLMVELAYTVYHERDVIVRSARVHSEADAPLRLQRALSCSVDLADRNFELLQLSGAWIRERHLYTRPLVPGLQGISSTRGTSSNQQNPFLALKRPDATETTGEVFGFSLVYSGNFQAQVEVDHYDCARVSLGINPFDFEWKLEPGESFQTPEVVMAYSDEGLSQMSDTFHELYRTRLARGQWRDRIRPVLINNWEATYFDFTEEKVVELAREAKEVGVELFVLDDGWFGKRNDDTTSLGDWVVDRAKLPNGIRHLADRITELGMGFGLWFEPEMVSKESSLYEEHPDWLIQVPNRRLSHGRNQYVLDYSRQEVVDYMFTAMSQVLSEAPITYVKWDMNRTMTEVGSLSLANDRQAEVPHRYLLGVYELYERLTETFPHVLFESCASGGARFDPGMLYYAPQGWTSDNTDAIERLSIQYGTSLVYPLSSMGAHVSAVPNHQVKRNTSLETRANVAYFGMFGYELDVTRMSVEEKREVKQQIDFYKEHRSLIQNGRFLRLISPFEGDGNVTSWMVVSPQGDEALVGYYQTLSRPNQGFKQLRLRGLDPDATYHIEGEVGEYYGDELMYVGLPLRSETERLETSGQGESLDFDSQLYYIKKG